MVTIIGSPYVPPDNTLLNVSSSGTMQLKPGTQGDILYAGASGVWAKLAAGTQGQYLQTQGASSNPTWSAPPGEGWAYLTKMSPSAASTVTSSTLTAYDEYLVICSNLVMSTSGYIQGQLNGDTGNNYQQFYMNNTTPTNQTGQPNFAIAGATTTDPCCARLFFSGKTAAVASGKLCGAIQASGGGNNVLGLAFAWTGGNATQVTTITFKTNTGNMTGTIEIFGRNRN